MSYTKAWSWQQHSMSYEPAIPLLGGYPQKTAHVFSPKDTYLDAHFSIMHKTLKTMQMLTNNGIDKNKIHTVKHSTVMKTTEPQSYRTTSN